MSDGASDALAEALVRFVLQYMLNTLWRGHRSVRGTSVQLEQWQQRAGALYSIGRPAACAVALASVYAPHTLRAYALHADLDVRDAFLDVALDLINVTASRAPSAPLLVAFESALVMLICLIVFKTRVPSHVD